MTISAFNDKESRPSFDEVCDLLGDRQALWIQLNQFMLDYYGLPGEWKYSGKNYGWMRWFHKGGRTLVSFYPQKESFTVQLVLGSTHVPQALNLKLIARVRRIIQEAPQLHDGRWLYIPVKTRREAADVEQLILIKNPLTKGKRPPTRGREGS